MPQDAILSFALRLLCAALVARLGRPATAPEARRLTIFVEQRSDELGALLEGAGDVEARERTALWSHAVAAAALERGARVRPARADSWDGWSLEVRQGRAVFTHPRAELSAREFALLRALLRNAGITLTREQLLEHAWPDDVGIAANTVDVYVGYLRRKLGADAIRTVRGIGYRLEPAAGEALRGARF